MSSGQFDAFLMELVSARSLDLDLHLLALRRAIAAHGLHRCGRPARSPPRGVSDEQTRTAVAELQQVLYDDPPAIFIAWPEAARAVRGTFEVPSDSNPDVMGTLWRWKPSAVLARASR